MSPRDGIRRRRIGVEAREDSILFFENKRAVQLGDARDEAQIAVSLALRVGRRSSIEGGPIDVGTVGH